MPSFDQTPDKPQPFGYKVSWFAVKASDPASVLDALELGEATPANWASGLAAAYGDRESSDHWVFVSPRIGAWVFVVGSWLPYPVAIEQNRDIGEKFDLLFSCLMKRFDDVQFLGSYRVVGFVTWARASKGKPLRAFGCGDDGVLANFGEQTAAEAQLGFADLTRLPPSDATDRIFTLADEQDAERGRLEKSGLPPRDARAKVRQKGRDAIPDETDVIDLAGLWSINPMELSEQDNPPGLGLAARLPKNLAQ